MKGAVMHACACVSRHKIWKSNDATTKLSPPQTFIFVITAMRIEETASYSSVHIYFM